MPTQDTAIKSDRKRSLKIMQAIDDATKTALADLGLEAFRFDIDVCPDENWMQGQDSICIECHR